MTNDEIRETFDDRFFDVESMLIDNENGNFREEDAQDYDLESIVMASLINGQFNQAEDQCRKFGLCYESMLDRYEA